MTAPSWYEIFDTGYVDTRCDLVREDINAQHLEGYIPTLHAPIRNILQEQIDHYIKDNDGIKDGKLNLSRIDIDAAYKLFLFAEELAERIEQSRGRDSDADDLYRFWMEFIAKGAAPSIYHDRPKVSHQNSIAGKLGAANRWSGREELNEIYDRLAKKVDGIGDHLKPTELWQLLIDRLDANRFDPQEHGTGAEKYITYWPNETQDTIKYKTFSKAIERRRKQ